MAIAGGAALLGAFGGRDDAAAAAAPIVGHVFRSVSVEQDGRPMPLFDGTTVWFSIERQEFRMHSGCNGMSGPLRVSADRIRVPEIFQTSMGCGRERERRDELLVSFLFGDPEWQLLDDRLVLTQGRTTITLERDDLPPPLPRTNPGRPQDLIDASIGSGEYQAWPQDLGDSWSGPFVKVDVAVRDGRTFLTMQTRCRSLEAPLKIRRATLAVGAPRTKTGPCRPSGMDDLRSIRPFFGGTVQWHLDRGRLTLQRDRSTLTLRAR